MSEKLEAVLTTVASVLAVIVLALVIGSAHKATGNIAIGATATVSGLLYALLSRKGRLYMRVTYTAACLFQTAIAALAYWSTWRTAP